MMKHLLISLPLVIAASQGIAQRQKPAEATPSPAQAPKESAHYIKVYKQALAYNDFAVATDAVHNILASGPEHSHYLDTLALLYFQRSAWPQVVAVCSDLLKAKPDAQGPMELRAVAFQTLGMPKESLGDYEKLYGLSKNAYHLYEIAALQYTMRRFGECEGSLSALMADPSIREKTIQLNAGQKAQNVPLPAACQNMLGVLLLEQGKRPEAVKAFEEALKTFPEFVLAQNNLTEAKKP